jgi:hypothetical protein
MKFTIQKLTCERRYNRKHEPYKHHNKMYIWPSKETVFENLINRHNRPHTTYKKEIIPLVMEMLKNTNEEVYNALKDVKWGWRQKCGCDCPCSPGFIGNGCGMYDIHVTFSVKE